MHSFVYSLLKEWIEEWNDLHKINLLITLFQVTVTVYQNRLEELSKTSTKNKLFVIDNCIA